MTNRIAVNMEALERFLQEKGWAICGRRDVEHGLQVIVTDGSTRLPVNFYHTGRIVVQGPPSGMKAALTEWANLHQAGLGPEPGSVPAGRSGEAEIPGPSPEISSVARIGVDESGKGDVFGPLVVAGVILTPDREIALAKIGVRDSKTLSNVQVARLAQQIREICPFEILVLRPPDYNVAYEEHGRNVNRLLAWAHARVIAKLCQRMPVTRAISDQFGDRSLLIQALAAEGCQIMLQQYPHAERDLAVAAASVIARDEFLRMMQEYAEKAGMEIPLGASSDAVREVGTMIYRRWGKRGLERIAKMHFKTVQEIIAEAETSPPIPDRNESP